MGMKWGRDIIDLDLMDRIYNMTSVIFHCLAHEDGILIAVANQQY